MGDFHDYREPAKDVLPACQSDLDTVVRYINIVLDGATVTPTEKQYLTNARALALKVRATIEDI